MASSSRDSPPEWAPKVAQQAIRRLYEADARGLYDDELLLEVGYACTRAASALFW
jgi:hypothetical protein